VEKTHKNFEIPPKIPDVPRSILDFNFVGQLAVLE
jgi:hypothetical protein